MKMRIRSGNLKNRLEKALNESMNRKVSIRGLKVSEYIEVPSRTFNVARMIVNYRKESSNRNEQLNLILKRLKTHPPKTDFSDKSISIHREIDKLPEYTRSLFEYLQGPINDGNEKSYLVRFYGQVGREIYEEDAGDISVERMFIEKTPSSSLLEELVNVIAVEHSKWAITLPPYANELSNLRREKAFREKLHDNLDTILEYNGNDKKLKGADDELLDKFFLGIDEYLKHPDFNIFTKLIHSDLHLGHIFLKYKGGLSMENIREMSKEELEKYTPEIKIIDITGMSLGPQTFDLVDMLKHPVAVNAEEYPAQEKQREFIEKLVEVYRMKRLEQFLSKFNIKLENGEPEIKKDLEFLTLFYMSNVYRDIRAIAKGILLKSKHQQLYKIYQDLLNDKYEFYASWYMADLGETLRYLSDERFEDSLKELINPKLIERVYDTLIEYLDGLDANPIIISKQIVEYKN